MNKVVSGPDKPGVSLTAKYPAVAALAFSRVRTVLPMNVSSALSSQLSQMFLFFAIWLSQCLSSRAFRP